MLRYFSLVCLVSSAIVGCSNSQSDSNTTSGGGPQKPASRGLDGSWNLTAKSCDGVAQSLSKKEQLGIGNQASALLFQVVTEEDETHLCKLFDGFYFQTLSFGRETSDSVSVARQTGILKPATSSRKCWKKEFGKRTGEPYQTEEMAAADSSPNKTALTQTDADHFTAELDQSPFCDGKQSVLSFTRIAE